MFLTFFDLGKHRPQTHLWGIRPDYKLFVDVRDCLDWFGAQKHQPRLGPSIGLSCADLLVGIVSIPFQLPASSSQGQEGSSHSGEASGAIFGTINRWYIHVKLMSFMFLEPRVHLFLASMNWQSTF